MSLKTTAVLAAVLAAVPGLSHAQQFRQGATGGGSLGGSSVGSSYGGSGASSGMFGSRSLGSSLSAGNRGFAGGTARGVGGTQQGVRPGQTLQGDAGAGQVQGNERFTRQGRQAGQFVGADTSDLPSFLTEIVGGGITGLNQRGRTQGQQGRNQNVNQAQGGRAGGSRLGQQQANYRISRSVAFNYPTPAPSAVQSQLGTRLQRSLNDRALGPIEVALQQRTVVLRGSVATAHDRDLAERLALLEAGVDRVQNELTIGSPGAPAASTPAPAGN